MAMEKIRKSIFDRFLHNLVLLTGADKICVILNSEEGIILERGLPGFIHPENEKQFIDEFMSAYNGTETLIVQSSILNDDCCVVYVKNLQKIDILVIPLKSGYSIDNHIALLFQILLKETLEKIEFYDRFHIKTGELEETNKVFLIRAFQMEERYERTKKINQIISDISAELDFENATEIVIRELKEIYSFEGYSLVLVDNDTHSYHYHSYHFPFELSEELKKILTSSYPIDERGGRIAEIILTNKHYYFSDIHLNTIKDRINKRAASALKIKSALFIPFGSDNEVFGVLAMYGHSRSLYLTDDDINIIKNFLQQISNVFRNAYLYSALEQKKKEIEKVYNVINAINSSGEFTEILDIIIKELGELFDFESYSLSIVDWENKTYRSMRMHYPFEISIDMHNLMSQEYPLNKHGGRIAESILKNKVFYFKDIHYHDIDNPLNRLAAEAFHLKSYLIIPLSSFGEVFGVITLSTHEKIFDLTETDITSIQKFLSQVSTAFKGTFFARLAIEKKNEIEKMNEFTRKVTASLNVNDVLNYITSYLSEKYHFQGHAISIKSERNPELLEILHIKLDTIQETDIQIVKNLGIPLNFDDNLITQSFKKNEVIYINDIDIFAGIPVEIRKTLEAVKIRSTINIPIAIDVKPVGVLTFYTYGDNCMNLTNDDIASLRLFTDHISAAIVNSALYDKVQKQKKEIEKEKDFTSSILEASPIAIATVDKNGALIQHNPAFQIFFGIDEQSPVHNFFEIPVISANHIYERVKSAYEGIAVKIERFDFVNSEKHEHYILEILAAPISGKIDTDEIMMMFIDNTEAMKKEKELEHRNKIIEEDMKMAKKIQENLLPKKDPVFEGFTFSSLYLPMEHLGGDFYDYIPIDEDNLGIFLSDVSGHGVSAAFITSMIKSNLDMEKEDLLNPATFFSRLQKKMLPVLTDKYFTAIYGVLNKANGTFTYSNAAHIPQLVYRHKKNIVEQITLPSIFIGLYCPPDESFEHQCIQLYPGDRIVLFTDGFVDNFTQGKRPAKETLKLDETYELLKEYITLHKKTKPAKFLNKMLEGAQKEHGKKAFSDDIALLLIEMQNPEKNSVFT